MTVHPYAGHPATLVLEAHEVAYWSRHGTLAHCTCGTTGTSHAAHLAEALHRAGLLAGPPAGTIGEAAEGDPGMEATLAWFRDGGC